MRRPIPLLLVSLLALLVPTTVASANSTQFTTLEAPNELLNSGSPDAALDEIDSRSARTGSAFS